MDCGFTVDGELPELAPGGRVSSNAWDRVRSVRG